MASAGKFVDGSPDQVYGYGQIEYGKKVTVPNATEHILRAVDLWFSQSKDYHSYHNRTRETFWFFQAVWKGLKKVGIGIAVGAEDQCGSNEKIWAVVNYDKPPMEYESSHQENVEAKPSKTEEECTESSTSSTTSSFRPLRPAVALFITGPLMVLTCQN